MLSNFERRDLNEEKRTFFCAGKGTAKGFWTQGFTSGSIRAEQKC